MQNNSDYEKNYEKNLKHQTMFEIFFIYILIHSSVFPVKILKDKTA